MSKLNLLCQLQNFDNQIEKVQEDMKDESLLSKIDRLEKGIANLKKQYQAEKVNLKKLHEQVKDKEFEEARLERQEEDYQQQLYSGENSNPKELEQLKDKLDVVIVQKQELEEELLDLMVQEETMQEKVGALEKEIEEYKEKLSDLQEQWKEQENKLKVKLQSIKEKRQQVVEELDEELVSKYNQLVDNKYGNAVVKIEDGYCMGCRMSLPINLVTEVKEKKGIVTCNNCGRILYTE
ncbi:zinc ribbon domain-containing protein [Halanaerocella petrolearia]